MPPKLKPPHPKTRWIPSRNRWLYLAGLTLALYFASGALFCSATLHVARRLPGAPPLTAQSVSIQARDNISLAAWWMPNSASHRCVLVLHGIGDGREGAAGFAPMLYSAGYSVLTPDSRAHGESGGEFVTYGLEEKYDATNWANWLRAKGCEHVYGLGESLGASILLQAEAEGPVFHAIVAECAFADLWDAADHRLRKLVPPVVSTAVLSSALVWARAVDGLNLKAAAPERVAARISSPVLLIHGLADDQTPPSHSERLAVVLPNASLWLVPGARHVSAAGTQPEEFRRRVLAWFAEH